MATVENPVRIHAGTFEDLDSVMEIMEAAFGTRFGEAWTRSQCAGILPMTGVSLMLARDPDGGTPVGFSLCRSVADESELLLLAVAPDHRRRGIGRGLLQNFLQQARTDGATRVHLEVRDGNPAVQMYRTAGFAPVGRRRNYYHTTDGRQFDALTFALEF
jgi:[ribosomal protein S18]-alanine N-acetyltransferase